MNESYAAIAPTRDEINALQEPVLIEFGAPWCGHCQAAQPLLAKALAAFPQLSHLKIEDGPGQPLGRSFRVKLWPTLIFLRQGEEIARMVRPSDAAQIAQAIEQLVTP
ncbi:thioredoxin family protein [Dechloromonas sp. A34]|uniref:thioredoxin family protein n=1 Tax=Dechloromonas sp. A34 TaxID=447588 RepID=UPI0022488638|nr:thioredoxin family protein [Dechloromonas sp. A34]